MSILIKGMEMPEAAEDCTFYEVAPFRPYPHCRVRPGESCAFPDDCPLIEVPTPHGRLKDADAFAEMLENYKKEYALKAKEDIVQLHKAWGLHEAELMAESLPTIIPASEEGE